VSIVDVEPPATVWESVATTRWGRYTTEVIGHAVCVAANLAGPPRSALEIGCEGGRWSRLLAEAGWSMTCTDIDPGVLSICQRRVPSANCVLVSPREHTVPCASETMYLVLCIEVFPVMHSAWFPAEAGRALAPGGVLVGVTQNRISLRGMFVRLKQYFKPTGSHFYNLSYSEWRRRMDEAGFDVCFERGFCWFPLSRFSDSMLTPLFAAFERWLGLHRWTAFSPWVVFIARRNSPVAASRTSLRTLHSEIEEQR
jgi:SAM-dependent methyltransferase